MWTRGPAPLAPPQELSVFTDSAGLPGGRGEPVGPQACRQRVCPGGTRPSAPGPHAAVLPSEVNSPRLVDVQLP